jgi:hypothetical protein
VDGENGGAGGGGRTFDQSQLDSIVTREKSAARAAAVREIAEHLGCTPEEAKQRLDAAAAAEQAQLTETQRAKADADRARSDADRDKKTAGELAQQARVERALLRALPAGVLGDDETAADARMEELTRLVMAGLPDGADDTAVKARVAALKTTLPALFTADGAQDQGGGGSPGGGAPSSDGKPPHRPTVPAGPWGSDGLAEARRRGFAPPQAGTQ